MGYRQVNSLLLVVFLFLLCAGVAFLLQRKNFFTPPKEEPMVLEDSNVGVPPVAITPSSEDQDKVKTLKSFGFCGDPSKNEVILSYPVDLLNALLDDVQGNHCESPKEGYPNYTFLLPDMSLIRLAEMTPDHKYIFYLKVETGDENSIYYLYKVDLAQKQNVLLEKTTIANDWPLQKDFYEEQLLPRQIENGKYLIYNWFIKDPKGESNSTNFLRGKLFDPITHKIIFIDPSGTFQILPFPPAVSSDGKKIVFRCGEDLCATNLSQTKKIILPESVKNASRDYQYFRFKDNSTLEVGFGGSTVLVTLSTI